MKDSTKRELKVLPAHKISIFILIFLSYSSTIAQDKCDERMYEVVNDIFNSGLGEARIYKRTLFNKGWANYFKDYEEIFSRVGVPTLITDAELKTILNEEEMRKIYSSVLEIRPCKLSSKYLNNKINLSKNFDTPEAIAKGVFRISQPIFVDDNTAVLKKESLSESSIFILQKRNGQWKILYTFYEWYKFRN